MDGKPFDTTNLEEGLAYARTAGYPLKVYCGEASYFVGAARDEEELRKFLEEGLKKYHKIVHLVSVRC